MDDDLKHLLDTLRSHNEAVAAESRRQFEAVVERIEKRFDTLAESVALVDQKVTHEGDRLDQKLDRGFS